MSSSALWLGDPEEKVPLTLFLTAPQDFPQKACRVGQKRHFWPSKARGAVKKSVRGPFSSGSPSLNAELDIVMRFFENSSVGPSYAAFRTVNDVKNVENWVKVNPKRGSIFRCPQKEEINRTRLTFGGNNLSVDMDCGTPTADLLTVKLLINSVISTPGANFRTLDIKDFYLNTRWKIQSSYAWSWITSPKT